MITSVNLQKLSPEQTISLGFLGVILTGTLLLLLPVSHMTRDNTLIDDLFTAVSATCVTGLSTVDTHTYWSGFGLVVIMLLIQVGGLGVMTLATVLGAYIQQNHSLDSKLKTSAEIHGEGIFEVQDAVRSIFKTSLTIESIAAIIMTLQFYFHYHLNFGDAVWHGIFHAVSAFNNAGFALYSDNLMGFNTDPIILMTISLLIILGGLGFPVYKQFQRYGIHPSQWNVSTKLAISGTLILLTVGTLGTFLLERTNAGTLAPMNFGNQVLNAFALTVSTRTAGFNNVDISALHNSTLFFTDFMMFIGGGPAGTAGGIKITTFAVLLFMTVTEVRGDESVNIFGRRIGPSVQREAITVVLLGVSFVFSSVFILQLITDFSTDKLIFEVISAYATVGLTAGITPMMPVAGKLILIALMILGRVGSVTVVAALASRHHPVLYRYPEERPLIG